MSRILPTPLVFISGYANTENVFYCLIVTATKFDRFCSHEEGERFRVIMLGVERADFARGFTNHYGRATFVIISEFPQLFWRSPQVNLWSLTIWIKLTRIWIYDHWEWLLWQENGQNLWSCWNWNSKETVYTFSLKSTPCICYSGKCWG